MLDDSIDIKTVSKYLKYHPIKEGGDLFLLCPESTELRTMES